MERGKLEWGRERFLEREGLHTAFVPSRCLGRRGLLADPLYMVLFWSWEDLCSQNRCKTSSILVIWLRRPPRKGFPGASAAQRGSSKHDGGPYLLKIPPAFLSESTKQQRSVAVPGPSGWGRTGKTVPCVDGWSVFIMWFTLAKCECGVSTATDLCAQGEPFQRSGG